MEKVRNAVIIIALCVVSGYQAHKLAAPRLILPPADVFHDALAGSPVNASRPLHLSNSDDDQLHDSVAGNAIPGFHTGPHGNTEDGTPPPPRGGGDNGGVGSFSGPNPGSQLPPPSLSPSGPASPYTPPSPPK